jgi:hypothetical protein
LLAGRVIEHRLLYQLADYLKDRFALAGDKNLVTDQVVTRHQNLVSDQVKSSTKQRLL